MQRRKEEKEAEEQLHQEERKEDKSVLKKNYLKEKNKTENCADNIKKWSIFDDPQKEEDPENKLQKEDIQ